MADARNLRCYRLTPDRAVVAMLALEAFLLLSAWFHWFAFNEHKGYAVLIAVASVGVFFVLMFLWFLAALVFRLRFQFGILALLLLVVVVAIPFSWLATEMKWANKQREAVEEITRASGTVSYDYQSDPSGNVIPGAKPPGPPWLRKLLGDDLFVSVTRCSLDQSEISDAGLEHIGGLTELRTLSLGNTTVSDAGLQHMEGLLQLQELLLGGTNVTDAGLEYLKGLTQLRWLGVGRTKVSDAGLKYVKGLTRLQRLDLWGTKVSDAGLRHLNELTQLQWLFLGHTNVSLDFSHLL